MSSTVVVVEQVANVVETPGGTVVATEDTVHTVELGVAGPQGPAGLAGTNGAAGATGPQGPQGAAGSPGSAPQAYTHVQATPASMWTIVHGLGFRPAGIHVENSAGDDCIGDIVHVSVNEATLIFSASFAGRAFCS